MAAAAARPPSPLPSATPGFAPPAARPAERRRLAWAALPPRRCSAGHLPTRPPHLRPPSPGRVASSSSLLLLLLLPSLLSSLLRLLLLLPPSAPLLPPPPPLLVLLPPLLVAPPVLLGVGGTSLPPAPFLTPPASLSSPALPPSPALLLWPPASRRAARTVASPSRATLRFLAARAPTVSPASISSSCDSGFTLSLCASDILAPAPTPWAPASTPNAMRAKQRLMPPSAAMAAALRSRSPP